MSNFKDFQKVSKSEWIEKIRTDLKGKDLSILDINNPIEELELPGYIHNEDGINQNLKPGNAPFLRGMNKINNDWSIGAFIEISAEKEANKKALKGLNEGAELLVFKAKKSSIDWDTVLRDIQVEYIQVQFILDNLNDVEILQNKLESHIQNIQFNLDFIGQFPMTELNRITPLFKKKQIPFCSINGFKIQQAGANTWQEIAFCLSAGHELLVELMTHGLSIDEASASISFKIGCGSNYFNETAKIRAFKALWAKIIAAYEPSHKCSHNCHITSVIGHMNKSLSDPYTNLLRQTTEAMSAINGGIDGIVILPYDNKSTKGSSELAERMALNISSILKEESYLNKVIDPLGGSYSIEVLTELISKKAWALFQSMDNDGGITSDNVMANFKKMVNEKRSIRIEQITNGTQINIGINKFMNPDTVNDEWVEQEQYLGLLPLIYEQEYKSMTV